MSAPTITVTPEQIANLRRWADALESGDYEQGYGRLHTSDDRFCCLGVICDLQVKAGAGSWAGADDGYLPQGWDDEEAYECWPPMEIAGAYALAPADRPGNPSFSVGRRLDGQDWELGDCRHVHLGAANDDGHTFPEIAAALRRYADALEEESQS